MKTYYVYKLINPITNLPFYVGKGKGRRAGHHYRLIKRGKNSSNQYKDNVIKQIIEENLEPTIEYVYYSDDEQDAYDYETALIKELGRKRYDANGILTNLCEDNRPPNQKGKYSDERKEIYRKRMIGNTINLGRTQSNEERKLRSTAMQKAWDSGSKVVTDAMREATRKTHTGKVVSDKTKQLLSKARSGIPNPNKGKTILEIMGDEAGKAHLKKMAIIHGKPFLLEGIVYPSLKAASKSIGLSEYKTKLKGEYIVSKKI